MQISIFIFGDRERGRRLSSEFILIRFEIQRSGLGLHNADIVGAAVGAESESCENQNHREGK
jgi:hypothetical protein